LIDLYTINPLTVFLFKDCPNLYQLMKVRPLGSYFVTQIFTTGTNSRTASVTVCDSDSHSTSTASVTGRDTD